MNKTIKFEDALDECIGRLLANNETIEQCLLSFPQYADRLKPLLETALATRNLSAIRPRAKFKEKARSEFREQARQQFQAARQEKNRTKSRISFPWNWQPGWAAAATAILVIVLAGGGTVYAAGGSMPDSLLYPVKTATEQVQLALTFSEIGKAELNAKLADKRVTEIIYLAEADKPEKMAILTQNMNAHLKQISAPAPASEETGRKAISPAAQPMLAPAESPSMLSTASTEAATTLEEPQSPNQTLAAPVVPPSPQQAVRTPDAKSQKAASVNATPAKGKIENNGNKDSQKADRAANLKTTVENQASNNNARLHQALEAAPASAKPALQKAIDESESEYKKAIDSLK